MVAALVSLAGCPDDTITPIGGSSDSGNTDIGESTVSNMMTDSLSGTSVGSTGADSSTGIASSSGSSSVGTGSTSDTGTTSTGTTGTGSTGTGSTGAESTGTGSTGAETNGSTDGTASSGESTTGVETGSESSTGETTTGIGFLIPLDLPPVECDLFDQDCPPNEKCMPFATDGGTWNAIGCFPIDDNPGAVGDVCSVDESVASGNDNCGEGAMCWDVDAESLEGVCVAMCAGSAESPICTDPNTICAQANDGLINLCLGVCDPLLQDCDGELGCYPVGDGFVCVPDASGDGGGLGEPCEFINGCDAGNVCLEADAYGAECFDIGCCSAYCDTDELIVSCPEPEHECLPYFDEGQAPPGLESTGICSVPA